MASYFVLLLLTLAELVFFVMLLRFFKRLRRSERLLTELGDSQKNILDKLELNANLESELMQSFAQRQTELARLDMQLEERVSALRKLLEQAEQVSRSPQFLRELILSGRSRGQSVGQLAKNTGLSVDEVELILAQSGG
jgi:uncharacterized protein HemX